MTLDRVLLTPDASTWAGLATARRPQQTLFGEQLAHWQLCTCRDLGIILERETVVIATGHQAGIWHPGILAKFIAVDALVHKLGLENAVAVHLVVDQDDNQPQLVDVPVRADAEAPMHAETLPMVDGQGRAATGMLPAARALDLTDRADIVPSARAGVRTICAALAAARDANATSLAAQFASACTALAQRWVKPMHRIRATVLLETTLGKLLVKHMFEKPVACARAYNQAVVKHPEAGLTMLEDSHGRIELPLWQIDATGNRARVYADDLASPLNAEQQLAPRALLMTAIMRLCVSNLFVHGTGGYAYDNAMEAWIRDWLHVTAMHKACATADVRMRFDDVGHDDDDDDDDVSGDGAGQALSISVERAQHDVRKALHDPARNNPASISQEKQAFLDRIAAAPRRSRERRRAFLVMHDWLRQQREEHADQLHAYQQRARRAERRAVESSVRNKRDWAFPLYPTGFIDQLAARIRQSVEKATNANRTYGD
ncbi:MAG: hypothetical protein ACR2GY_09440 [Phycisphaerales bacterium]